MLFFIFGDHDNQQSAVVLFRNSILRENVTMLSQFETRMLDELISKKELFLSYLDTSEKQDKYRKAKDLYQKIEKEQLNYISSIGNETLAREAYSVALKDKKIDPFIAGGVAQAIGGTIPGAYTAAKAASQNIEIEKSRSAYKTMVFEDSAVRIVAETTLRSLLYRLDELFRTEERLRNYRNSLLEMDYQAALQMKDKKEYESAKAAFLSLGNYKDSVSQAALCKNNKIARSVGFYSIVSTVLSCVIVLISGVFTAGIEASILVFIIAFIISEIIFTVMFLKKTDK